MTVVLILVMAVAAAWLVVFLLLMRRSALALMQVLQEHGVDPDRVLLGAVADEQTRQRRRQRSPVEWVAMRYILWVRRGVKDPDSSTRGRKP